MVTKDDDLFSLVLANIPNLVFVKDEAGVVRYANEAMLEIYAPARRETLIGSRDRGDFRERDAAFFEEQARLASASGRSAAVEEVATHDGVVRTFHTTTIAFTNGSGERLLLGILNDITTAARRERRLLDANELLQRFSLLAAHDFRAPLSSYVAALEAVTNDRETSLSPQSRQCLEAVIAGAMNLSGSLRSLLRTSKGEAAATEAAVCDLNQILQQARFNLASLLRTHAVHVYSDQLPTLAVDGDLFRQLFQNLIENAVKYRDRTRRSHVMIGYERRPGGHCFVVEDNGLGVSRNDASRVFDLFEQGERLGFDGVGIGLALCKRIVAVHAGRIVLDPEYTGGCRLLIELPVRDEGGPDRGDDDRGHPAGAVAADGVPGRTRLPAG